ncbi:MAG: SUF system NifU family Fe-S cluster assembly protein [Chloroflexi bacterium]|nr:SUF system NifU family Fe-S cluster assembly protein [Chloroflexota bacterium]MCH8194950.1 SUF system NifU family Fe-S cluster assembly protein [Chloroflexota bacterium]
MSELRELYQEIVLDHNSRPRNFKEIEDADRVVEGFNPLCGDKIMLYVKFEGDTIADIGFQGTGCAISRASASLMTQQVKGGTVAQAEKLFDRFHEMVTGTVDGDLDFEDLGDLEVMAGVSNFPSRVKCATLSWHSLRSALKSQEAQVTTE